MKILSYTISLAHLLVLINGAYLTTLTLTKTLLVLINLRVISVVELSNKAKSKKIVSLMNRPRYN